jgi:hypothetical protein
VYDDIRGSYLIFRKPLLHKEVLYVETYCFDGINIVKPAWLSQKNRQQFISTGQEIPARQLHRTPQERKAHCMSNGTTPAQPTYNIPFAAGPA